MQSLIFSAILIVTAVVSSQPAAAANARYCLQGRIWGYPGNCQFMTYEQCAATASGTDASCDVNPRYAFDRQNRGQRGYGPY
jgi:hypothetical protein